MKQLISAVENHAIVVTFDVSNARSVFCPAFEK